MKLDAVLRWILFPGALAGFMLHAYTCFLIPENGPDGFTAGLFALSILPYLACLAVGTRTALGLSMAACAILPLLLLSLVAFYEAIIAPTSSTSSLVLLVTPVINLVVLLLGFLVGWVVFALSRRSVTNCERKPRT